MDDRQIDCLFVVLCMIYLLGYYKIISLVY